MKHLAAYSGLLLLAVGCERAAPSADVPASASAVPLAAPARSSATPPVVREAPPGYLDALPERDRDDPAPAKRYAALSSSACLRDVQGRKLPVKPARGKTPGLTTPLVVTGPLRGISFEIPPTLYGFVDCRLVLMLDDLAGLLADFGVASVLVNNIYRPGAERAAASTAATAGKLKKPPPSKKKSAKSRKPTPDPARISQHALGLAVDITEFRLKDGRTLSLEKDFRGKLGQPPCGPASKVDRDDPSGVALRNIVCAIARAGLCNHLITPNRDESHFNHIHCDIQAGAREVTVE